MLWLDLQEPSEKEESEVRAALELSGEDAFAEADKSPSLTQRDGYLKVKTVVVTAGTVRGPMGLP